MTFMILQDSYMEPTRVGSDPYTRKVPFPWLNNCHSVTCSQCSFEEQYFFGTKCESWDGDGAGNIWYCVLTTVSVSGYYSGSANGQPSAVITSDQTNSVIAVKFLNSNRPTAQGKFDQLTLSGSVNFEFISLLSTLYLASSPETVQEIPGIVSIPRHCNAIIVLNWILDIHVLFECC